MIALLLSNDKAVKVSKETGVTQSRITSKTLHPSAPKGHEDRTKFRVGKNRIPIAMTMSVRAKFSMYMLLEVRYSLSFRMPKSNVVFRINPTVKMDTQSMAMLRSVQLLMLIPIAASDSTDVTLIAQGMREQLWLTL